MIYGDHDISYFCFVVIKEKTKVMACVLPFVRGNTWTALIIILSFSLHLSFQMNIKCEEKSCYACDL